MTLSNENLSFVELACECPESDLPILRELISYDALCPTCCNLVRHQGRVIMSIEPSPLHWSRQIEWPWIVRQGSFKKSDRVLDVGCGWSVLKFAIAKRAGQVYCIDHDQDSVNKATATVNLINAENIVVLKSDASAITFGDNTFNQVVCCSVLEHMKANQEQAINEMVRVLKPGGTLLLTFDLVIFGTRPDDFYIDIPKANQIFQQLQVGLTSGVCNSALFDIKDDSCRIVVAMIKYTKPC